jgi:hypothetical protein
MRCEVVSAVTSAPVAYGFVALHLLSGVRERMLSSGVYTRLRRGDRCIQLFSANITADDPFEMVARESFQIISSRCT